MESRREFLKKAALVGSTAAVSGLAGLRGALADQEEERQKIAQVIGEVILQDMQGKRRDDPAQLFEKLGGKDEVAMEVLKDVFGTRTSLSKEIRVPTRTRLNQVYNAVINAEKVQGVAAGKSLEAQCDYSILRATQARTRINQ